MKKILAAMIFLVGFTSSSAQQVTPHTTAKKTQTVKKTVSSTPMVKLKKDGTPDKRYKANQKLKKDGTPDKRYKGNK